MMNDLISRQAAIDALDKRFDDVPMELTTEILQLRRDLRQLPSADAVEIVRCRDCKHNPNDTWFECPIAHLPYKEDRWCWKGKRKDG